MADAAEGGAAAPEADEMTPGYTAPAKVGLDELQKLDADDEALNRWKAQLLAGAEGAVGDDPRKVIVDSMELLPVGRDPMKLQLTGDLTKLKDDSRLQVQEGSTYRIKINFKVQNEVVAGLKYVHTLHRKGIKVGKENYMLGSYGPKADLQWAQTPQDEFPKGMLARGSYVVKSKFIDDDQEVHLAWEWAIKIAKDWA